MSLINNELYTTVMMTQLSVVGSISVKVYMQLLILARYIANYYSGNKNNIGNLKVNWTSCKPFLPQLSHIWSCDGLCNEIIP